MDTATKYDARFVELANQNAIMPTHTNGAGANGAVQPQTSETRQEPSKTEGQPLQRRVRSSDLIDFLTDAGYSFRLNLCDDSIEVNGECITDVIRSQIRCKLRDAGLGKFLAAAEDALVCFRHAIALGQEQAALAWQLRAAMSQVRLYERLAADQLPELEGARHTLAALYARYTEGHHLPDLCEAAAFLGVAA